MSFSAALVRFVQLPPVRRTVLAGLLLLAPATSAVAQDGVTIGVSAPFSGYYAVLGEQIETGARAALDGHPDIGMVTADDACSAKGGASAADTLIARGVAIAIGFPCIEAFDAAMPKLADAGIPVILLGVRAEGITAQAKAKGWPLLRLAPHASDEAEALAAYLKSAWRDAGFAIVDDGTLYGRDLSESVRLLLEEDNLKPVFVDTYRPQLENQVALVRRLQKAGATKVLIGGDAYDAAIIGNDAISVGAPLAIAGGGALLAPPEDGVLPDGTLVAAPPDWLSLEPAARLREKLADQTVSLDGYLAPAHAAVEVALAATGGLDADGHLRIADMANHAFETVLGAIRFDADGQLEGNPIIIYTIENGLPVPAAPAEKAEAIR